MAIPVEYDEDGRPISPKFTAKAKAEADYLGYSEEIATALVSCVCTSEIFFHVRWAYFDDDPSEDDGETLCGRRRRSDRPGFWIKQGGRCVDCIAEVKLAAEDIGDDMGWT